MRIVRQLSGVMDRVPLGSLVPGFVYELNQQVAEQLIEMGGAVPVRAADPETVRSMDDLDFGWFSGGIHVSQPDSAHDARDRRQERDRRKTR